MPNYSLYKRLSPFFWTFVFDPQKAKYRCFKNKCPRNKFSKDMPKRNITNDFFGIPRQNRTRWVCLLRAFWFSKFDLFWSELDLTLGQMWKWVSPSNSTAQMILKTCVTWHSCYIFIRWPHLTWTWPWPVLSISLLFMRHLLHPFSSIFAEFVNFVTLADVISGPYLVPRVGPWTFLDLGIWPWNWRSNARLKVMVV